MKKQQIMAKKNHWLIARLVISIGFGLILPVLCIAAPPPEFKFNISHFSVEGSLPLPESFFSNYFKPLQNRPYTLKELQEVSKALELLIHNQGYPLYRVIVPPQSLESGDVKLQVTTVDALNCKVPKP
jgi:hypothetical protein